MNRGQLNSPFNRNNSPDVNKSLSPDFIPFGYSSPLSSMKGGRNFNKPYNKGVMRIQDRSFSSPSSNGSSNFFSPNSSNSFGSSNNNWSGQYNRSNNYNRHKKNRHRNSNYKGYNSDLYYHCSMVEDPWATLEKKLIDEVGPENIRLENKYGEFGMDNPPENDKFIASSEGNSESEVLTTKISPTPPASVTIDSGVQDVSSSTSNVVPNET